MRWDDFEVAVFDCDGVILDSNPIKVAAFRWALRHYGQDHVESLVRYHHDHGGISRHEKLRYFFEQLLDRQDSEGLEKATVEFAEYCEEHLPRCPLIPGLRHFLDRFGCVKYVVTGGDQTEVRAVLGQYGLLDEFREVLGSPISKQAHLDRLASQGRLSVKGVYFGDARLDYELATAHGLDFVFLSGSSDWCEGNQFCLEQGVTVLRDFQDA